MKTTTRLLLASGLMLFLELALIRWLGANVLHLSYFTNFVLLGSFLGIGLGFLLARTRRTALPWSPIILTALVALVLFASPRINRASDEIIYFTSTDPTGPPAWVTLPLIFAAVAATLLGPAEAVARCFRELAPLDAYRLDLIGSLGGIAGFTALSFARAPSVVWGIVVAGLYLALLQPKIPMPATGAATILVGLLALESSAAGISWSPYYKVKTDEIPGLNASDQLRISVNGIPHQTMRSAKLRLQEEAQYGIPYERFEGNQLRNVLIVGAGSGSDVAIALSKGARHVDAVEIDPRILQIGEQRHPDRPYDDRRVSTYVNDGRAFLEQTNRKYDLILFALPDSLVLVSGASTIRLESYLFTEEAIAAARRLLSPGGGFAMYNYYREDRLIDRLAGTVAAAFGHEPCIDRVGTAGGQAVISAGRTARDQSCGPRRSPLPVARAAPATDDRPFVYFFGSSLPSLYLLALGGILALSSIFVRALSGPFRDMRPYVDLFFMGAAFLLLETKNVTSFALLFGTTWVVNAVVFGGVLVAVLLAVETTRRLRTPSLPMIYIAVAASLAVAYAVPNAVLLQVPLAARVVAAVALSFAPIYLANVAFAKRFAAADDSRAAFAVNILGAMAGGCLEYLALLSGYRNLLILTALLYGVAFLLTPRRIGASVA